ncbi:MAG: YdcF family protein [Rhodoferax sp.]|uniref:YdcF family protein n=1 Tax=Rhodoferax sp. TaxID=50421 RepID=UPI002733CE74|nr:YdcF family protein [Rhodoferax sp.]MDP3336813.1 YdcF family protein [Rhodoferax sp.]
MITPLRLFGWALLLLIALAVGDFYRRTQSTFVPTQPPQPGVVFTGQFSRVYAGLSLLELGQITPLLISGVNPGAGIPVASFADQFQLSATLRVAIASGALVLATEANNTIENARETRHWLTTLSSTLPIVLITNQFHMPRASLALEQALSGRQVLRYVVTENRVRYEGVVVEFSKYLGTHVFAWLPHQFYQWVWFWQ